MASFPLAVVALFSSLLLIISLPTILVSSHEFQVGGEVGWVQPTDDHADFYNEWAAKNRFHVGDTIYFKYENDSVLVVDREDYESCNVSKPTLKFDDGETAFEFDRYGFFFFISGDSDHCNSGQKMIIRVMVHSGVEPPESAPSPGESARGSHEGDGRRSDDFGRPRFSSSTKLSAHIMTTVVGSILFFLYMFM